MWAGLLLFMVIPLAFIFIPAIDMIFYIRLKKRCTEKVEAMVVRVEREDNYGTENSTSLRNVFGYTYEGIDYECKGKMSSFIVKNVGCKVNLFIDPNEPEKAYYPGEVPFVFAFEGMFVFIGIMILIVFIWLIIKSD